VQTILKGLKDILTECAKISETETIHKSMEDPYAGLQWQEVKYGHAVWFDPDPANQDDLIRHLVAILKRNNCKWKDEEHGFRYTLKETGDKHVIFRNKLSKKK
jgi:hypothetical protein